jgi:hypothetical protein
MADAVDRGKQHKGTAARLETELKEKERRKMSIISRSVQDRSAAAVHAKRTAVVQAQDASKKKTQKRVFDRAQAMEKLNRPAAASFLRPSSRNRQKRLAFGRVSSTSSSSLHDVHHRQADYPCEDLKQLCEATSKDAGRHPKGGGKGAVDIKMFVKFKKFTRFDYEAGNVNLSFTITLRWNVPNLKGHRLIDVNDLWKPTLTILNGDVLEIDRDDPWWYPGTGDVKQVLHFHGTVANDSDLQHFPFDVDRVRLVIVAGIGTGDRYVRLMWQTSDNNISHEACDMTSKHFDEQNYEWDLMSQHNAVWRLYPVRGVCGQRTGIEIRLHFERSFWYYLQKIVLLVELIGVMSWFAVMYRDPDTKRVDMENLRERLDFVAALLLTCVAFMYTANENIPKVNYWTVLDKVLLTSFLRLFWIMVESVIMSFVSEESYGFLSNSTFHTSSQTIVYIDNGMFWIGQVLLMSYQYTIMFRAWSNREVEFGKGYSHKGIEPALLKDDIPEVGDFANNKLWWQIDEGGAVGRGSVGQQDEEGAPSWDQGANSVSALRRNRRTSTSFGSASGVGVRRRATGRGGGTFNSRNVAKDDGFLHDVLDQYDD